jgi:hypothetical protein
MVVKLGWFRTDQDKLSRPPTWYPTSFGKSKACYCTNPAEVCCPHKGKHTFTSLQLCNVCTKELSGD